MVVLPRLVAIEFPGVLRDPADPSKALEAMGGVKLVSSYITTPPSPSVPRLGLSLRTCNQVSQSNINADPPRPTPNLFLIQITPSSPSSQPPPTIHDALINSTEGASSSEQNSAMPLTVTIIGRVTAITEFRTLADFQYHPSANSIHPYEYGAGYEASSSPTSNDSPIPHQQQLPLNDRRGIAERVFYSLTYHPARELTLEQCIDRLRPVRLARPAPDRGNFNYWYRQYAFPLPAGQVREDAGPLRFVPGQPLGNDRRSQPDRLRRLPHRVSYAIDSVPEIAPSVNAPVVRGRAVFSNLVTLLRLLFQQRPVWLRRALLLGVPEEMRANFKKAIACVAYSFRGSGAFFQACVKYGYDPRKDPNSRKYQVLEIRCGHPLHEAVRSLREEEHEKLQRRESQQQQELVEQKKIVQPRTRSRRKVDYDLELENQKAGTSGITVDLFKMPREFILDDVPMKKNNFYQICDMKVKAIKDVIDSASVSSTYDSKNGFFTEEGIAKVMKVTKKTLFTMSEQVLGKERTASVLKAEHYPAVSKSTKRGRLQLKDVIKSDVSLHPKRLTRSSSKRKQSEDKGETQNNDADDDDNNSNEDVNPEDDDENNEQVQTSASVLDEDIEAQEEYAETVDVTSQMNVRSQNSETVTADDDDEEVEDDEDGYGEDNEAADGEEEEFVGEELTGFEVYGSDDEEENVPQEEDYEDDDEEDNYL